MVLIEFPVIPGDVLERKLPLGAKGRAIFRDLDNQKVNFLVCKNGHQQAASIPQNYRLQEGEVFDMRWTHQKEETTKEVIVMEPSAQRIVFVVGSTIILKRHIACYFLLKLYNELLSSSRFMSVCFSNRSLVTHGKIVRVLEEGVVIKVLNRPKNTQINSKNTSSSSSSLSTSCPSIITSSSSTVEKNDETGSCVSHSNKMMVDTDNEERDSLNIKTETLQLSGTNPEKNQSVNSSQLSSSLGSLQVSSSSLGSPENKLVEPSESEKIDEEDLSQEIFISNEDLKFAEVIEDLTLVEPYVEAIMKMVSVQPGDEVTIKGKSDYNKMKVRSITVPLANPFQKKATVDGTQISFRATNLVLHSKTKTETETRTVYLKNGDKYKKVFWSKTKEDLLGVYFDEDTSTLFAEIIDESNVVGKKRTRVPNCEVEAVSKAQRIA